ncbi:MAG: peptidylprolyl isomerase [Tissierellia bacterium]|nr:peptidylprolyl isomerase [Tissierellia bacterium]
MKKFLIFIMMALILTSCGNNVESDKNTGEQVPAETEANAEENKEDNSKEESKDNDEISKEEKMNFDQLKAPVAGEELAVLHTSMGDIVFRLFPNAAPKTVENFKTHIEKGYYNGVIFHRVIDGFMIQGGDPTGTGRGGESIWGTPFEDEVSIEYRNLRGALSMANAGPSTNGSQFFVVQGAPVSKDIIGQMKEAGEAKGYPNEVVEAYEELGGAFWLDGKHTVFGQVVDGMDVVDAIAKVEKDQADKPLKDVVIESAEIIKSK